MVTCRSPVGGEPSWATMKEEEEVVLARRTTRCVMRETGVGLPRPSRCTKVNRLDPLDKGVALKAPIIISAEISTPEIRKDLEQMD